MYRRQQLRELAILNINLRRHSMQPRGSVSPFGSIRIKHAKTRFQGTRHHTRSTLKL
ncbi:hypothetical protein HanIR_Chr07g0336081 [Helianthus annuus]|nr:hypothetical protein HanIR_Chr07g0336081 [Helianthus annuus]